MDKQTDKKPQSRRLSGIVTSDKMDKTIVVRLDRRVAHPKYGKYFTKSTKIKAHDAKGLAKIGDTVVIEETRPLSKDKCWRLISVSSQAK
ncbi:MAG: 30S ribosomal protein S17 [Patescibacteria group bacterium]|nr:30S ribosomal protein S17 [Patescibacteria group bacterium]